MQPIQCHRGLLSVHRLKIDRYYSHAKKLQMSRDPILVHLNSALPHIFSHFPILFWNESDQTVKIVSLLFCKIRKIQEHPKTYTLYSKSVALSGNSVVWVSVFGITFIPWLDGTTISSVNRPKIKCCWMSSVANRLPHEFVSFIFVQAIKLHTYCPVPKSSMVP